MLTCFSALRDFTLTSVALRMFLAVVCGGIIGLERTFRRRPAGMRTHMLICLGASMTTLISQYLLLYMHYYTDIARLGAQVVAGIGFIGAGTIIITRHQKVTGLTTAAGLWTTAIVGLALGAGFFEGGLCVTGMVLLAEVFFSRLERLILRKSPEMNLYIHYAGIDTMEQILTFLRSKRITVLSLQITRPKESHSHTPTALFLLRLNPKIARADLLQSLQMLKGVISIDELSC